MLSGIARNVLWLSAFLSTAMLVMWVEAGLFVELGLLPEQ